MKKQLFQKAFNKAEEKSGRNTEHGLSTYLESYFSNELMFPVNRATFIRYYKKYIKDEDISYNPNTSLLNKIAEYIGYDSYEAFVISNSHFTPRGNNSGKPTEENDSGIVYKWQKKNKILIIISVLILAFILIKVSIKKQRWMVWNQDHYTEVKFDIVKYNLGQLKEHKKEQIKNFKKINSPDCNTPLLNDRGEALVWYWKKNNEEIELYTSAGLHPTNGKTLKPITKHMIRKYICID